MAEHDGRIPVILDTDIGSDIDDTWALGMLLKSPELDTKLVVSDEGDTVYRAALIARVLECAGRSDIPVGVGMRREEKPGPQQPWLEGYTVSDYHGEVREDGIQAIIDTIMASEQPITLICIGPTPNIAKALEREPGIASRARFVGMHGSFNWSHMTGKQEPEYNVYADAPACRAALEAPWMSARITPLDTCGRIVLDGARYQRLLQSDDPLLGAVLDNYRTWAKAHPGVDPSARSTTLFDTVAIYLAFADELCRMERMGVRVTDDGRTVRDDTGALLDVALEWKDKEAFLDLLTERMLAPVLAAASGGSH
ncbi:MAG: nucleoside hydrolase [Chitinivibrionales bacterium]|nr:nucleoside hydrolase [Chitinivibrionales bacterium]